MKIMFVHGIGFHEEKKVLSEWVKAWDQAIRQSCAKAGVALDFIDPLGLDGKPGAEDDDHGILYYEELIRGHEAPTAGEYLAVVGSLLKSYLATKVQDFFTRERGMFDLIDDEMKWKAREVAVWAHDDRLRQKLRKRVVKEIRAKNPDVVIAHSYGGLITYDACIFEDPDLLKDRYYVTLGTQIGNPLLRREFGGLQPAVNARHWFNLYNPGDPVFVVPLDHIRADNFTHLEVAHDSGHDGGAYLGHPRTADQVWRAISQGDAWLGRTRSLRARPPVKSTVRRGAENRALLVGIDEYASPDVPPLKGCVNDTYQLSAALQESGMEPKSIRMLHNGRATRETLLSQLCWLLDDAQPGDHRFFSFSGHGHRMASCNVEGEADEMEEILVTHDYAFTHTTGLRDRDFQDIYAYLPRDVHFLIFLDCCHSGGITRSGGPLVRSFMGPSDIEHEYMKWNVELQMWEQMGLAGKKGLNADFFPKTYRTKAYRDQEHARYYGSSGDLRRIGRATPLRDLHWKKFDRIAGKMRALHGMESVGPYLPLVFMACGEAEKACEYVHGSVSYGAFTYAMAQALRDTTTRTGKPLSYQGMLNAAAHKLQRLGYTQTPDILGHDDQKSAIAPFGAGSPSAQAKVSSHRKKTSKQPK